MGTGNNGLIQSWERSTSGCILSPCLFNFYAECIMWNAWLDEAQGGIKIAGRNINNLRYADDTTFMAEKEEEVKRLLMKVNKEWKSWLKTQYSKNKDNGIQSHHFMANRRGNNRNSVRLYFLGLQNQEPKILGDDCRHEIKRHLPPLPPHLVRKAMTNLDSVLKNKELRCLQRYVQ